MTNEWPKRDIKRNQMEGESIEHLTLANQHPQNLLPDLPLGDMYVAESKNMPPRKVNNI